MSSKIYKIVCNVTKRVYIGSTTHTLEERLARHLKDFHRYAMGADIYLSSFEIFKLNNYQIELVEDVGDVTAEQLIAIERNYIESTEDCVNIVVPGRTRAEYREARKEKIADLGKAYYQKNKCMINARKAKFVQEHPHAHRAAMKKYASKKVACECGAIVSCAGLAKHRRSNAHIAKTKP